MDEFLLIKRYFASLTPGVAESPQVVLGVGDDCALLDVPSQQHLAVSIDTLVSGVHFLPDTHPADIAYKALAVNLSDLAAMGASPAWFTLALTLPEVNEQWLQPFAQGLARISDQFNIPLVGGDTTRGPLTITIQVAGHIPRGAALRRSGAATGDDLYVSGELGWGSLGLAALGRTDLINIPAEFSGMLEEGVSLSENNRQSALDKLLRPTPRVALGLALREFASSCIDVSDGIIADLGHLVASSQMGVQLDGSLLPIAPALKELPFPVQLAFASFGDDYELLFSAPVHHRQAVAALKNTLQLPITRIGSFSSEREGIVDMEGNAVLAKGYNHFGK